MASLRPREAAFVRFDKDLYDALLEAPLTHTQLLVALAVVRLTIGHHDRRNGARIPVRFIMDRTGLGRTAVRNALRDLRAAGVVIETEPASGRRAATLALQTVAALWGGLCPGNSRRKRAGNVAAWRNRRSVECAPDDPLRSVEGAPDGPQSAHQTALYGPLMAHQTTPTEERSTEDEDGASADAPPPSSEEPGTTVVHDWLEKKRAEKKRRAIRHGMGGS